MKVNVNIERLHNAKRHLVDLIDQAKFMDDKKCTVRGMKDLPIYLETWVLPRINHVIEDFETEMRHRKYRQVRRL